MKTADGEDEMFCRTNSAVFDTPEGKIKRGVISFYATKTLLHASTTESWLQAMTDAMAADAKNKRLSKLYQKQLQILGDGKTVILMKETVNK